MQYVSAVQFPRKWLGSASVEHQDMPGRNFNRLNFADAKMAETVRAKRAGYSPDVGWPGLLFSSVDYS